MPGMTNGLNINDPIVVAAFRTALLHQGIAALLIFAVLSIAWVAIRERRTATARAARRARAATLDSRAASAGRDEIASPAGSASTAQPTSKGANEATTSAQPPNPASNGSHAASAATPAPAATTTAKTGRLSRLAGDALLPEPGWRQLLRVGFGLLWLFDGILQAQPAMAVGLPSQIIKPAAGESPHWVQALVNWAGTAWSYHPVQAGAAAVWVQVGIGLWLLFAPRGIMSRLAGVAGVVWGLIVWVFGEAFGEIFAPGLNWLTGAPGAVAFYIVGGVLVALPVRSWYSPRAARLMAGGAGLFLGGMAVLQAWPGRGSWQGTVHGQPSALTAMAQEMSGTPQPAPLARLVTNFGSVAKSHGFAINLVTVVVLLVSALAFLAAAIGGPKLVAAASWRRRVFLGTVIGFSVVCLAAWVLIQDIGFFGGLGTDPNSMLPMILLAVAAYLALTRGPAPDPATAAATEKAQGGLAALGRSLSASGAWTMLTAWAIGIVLIGAIPLTAAQASSNASPILAEAIDGSSAPLHTQAPGFELTDQHGRTVSLASLRGKAVLLTFLDPVCVTDCPLEAQEFREAGVLLGSDNSKVKLVAVNLNPLYNDISYTQAFDREEQLAGVPNWLFLTGSPGKLRPIWRHYGVESESVPGGAMLLHSDVAFVIGPDGRMREEINFDPGPGTAATKSSFAAELAAAARQAIRAS
jgi:cytochrome oxidase Cu insertion factor (SCO1/SenC/PrrC family)